MPGTSPGWPGLGPSSLVMLVTLATTAVTLSDLSDNDKTTVRLDIGTVDQPANCSGFLDDLEALLTKTAVYTQELNPRSRMSEVEVRVPRHWDWHLCDIGGRRRSAG